jgi:MFS superfamily sulfate permease-like transporter
MVPHRPAVFAWQWPLAILAGVSILAGIGIVVWALWK